MALRDADIDTHTRHPTARHRHRHRHRQTLCRSAPERQCDSLARGSVGASAHTSRERACSIKQRRDRKRWGESWEKCAREGQRGEEQSNTIRVNVRLCSIDMSYHTPTRPAKYLLKQRSSESAPTPAPAPALPPRSRSMLVAVFNSAVPLGNESLPKRRVLLGMDPEFNPECGAAWLRAAMVRESESQGVGDHLQFENSTTRGAKERVDGVLYGAVGGITLNTLSGTCT